jgi:uncharacterized protein (DUF488 family)
VGRVGSHAVVATIGYEGRDVDGFLAALRAEGVTLVADVRATPISRKAGFSKRVLAAALAGADIGYEHLGGLGNPKDNREPFRAGRPGARRRYERRLDREGAADLARLRSLVADETVALLCLEHDPAVCHRAVIADRLRADDPGVAVRHL